MTDDEGAARRGAALPPRVRAVLAAGVLGLLLGVLWGVADVPRYTASATVLVTGDGGVPAAGTELGAAAQLADSAKVADRAAALIGGDVGGADLLSDIAATTDDGAGAVRIDATADQPDFAAAAANGYALALAKAGGRKFDVGAAATIPSGPSEGRSGVKWGLLGLVLGLLLGALGVAIHARLTRPAGAREQAAGGPEPEPLPAGASVAAFDFPERPEPEPDPVPEPEPEFVLAEDAFGVPVLASFDDPDDLIQLDEGAVAVDRPTELTLDQLVEGLRIGDEEAPRTLAVIDVADGDGSLPVVTGLAIAVGKLGLRTILVEADFEQPWLAAHVGVDPAPGLRDYLSGSAGPRDVLRTVRARAEEKAFPLVCVPAGELGEPGVDDALPDGLGGERFAALIGRLPRVYDLVLVAGPPATATAESGAVANLVDAVVMVSADDDEAGLRIAAAVDALPSESLVAGVLTRPSPAQSRPQSAV